MQGKKTELRTDLHSALALRSKAKSEPVRRAAVRMLEIANALDDVHADAGLRFENRQHVFKQAGLLG